MVVSRGAGSGTSALSSTTMTHSLKDTLAVTGNSNHLLGFINHYEAQIAARGEESCSLSDAPSYYAWLCVTSEYVYYAVKKLIFFESLASDSAVFDLPYSKVLDRLLGMAEVTQPLKDDVLLFARIRHLLVHKGFPNPHDAPTAKARTLANDIMYQTAEVWEVCNRIRNPREYSDLKLVFSRVIRDLANLHGAFEFSF